MIHATHAGAADFDDMICDVRQVIQVIKKPSDTLACCQLAGKLTSCGYGCSLGAWPVITSCGYESKYACATP
jgi:hypothetical protein